jgi:hypothetical protein
MNVQSSRHLFLATLALAALAAVGTSGDLFAQAMGPLKPGVAFRQGDIYSRPAASAEECAKLCEQDTRCRSMTYIISQQRCWIKNRVPPTAQSRDMVSAIKLTGVKILDFNLARPLYSPGRFSFDLHIRNYNNTPSTFNAYCHWKCPGGLILSWGADVQSGAYLSPGESRSYKQDAYSIGCKPEPAILSMTCSIDMKVSGVMKNVDSLTKQVQIP